MHSERSKKKLLHHFIAARFTVKWIFWQKINLPWMFVKQEYLSRKYPKICFFGSEIYDEFIRVLMVSVTMEIFVIYFQFFLFVKADGYFWCCKRWEDGWEIRSGADAKLSWFSWRLVLILPLEILWSRI